MSATRQLAIADIQKQIANAELVKTQNFYGPPGRVITNPVISVDGTQITEQEANDRINVLKAEEKEDSITDEVARQAKIAQTRMVQGALSFGNGIRQRAKQSNRFLGNIPTPGDVWVPLWILLFIFMILIPVNGHTRLYWLWLVIVGHAELTEEYNYQQNPNQIFPGIGLTATANSPLLTTQLNNPTTTTISYPTPSPTAPVATPVIPPPRTIITPTEPVVGVINPIPYLDSINTGGL